MKLKDRIHAILHLFQTKLLNRYSPLVVRWDITYRCIMRCGYCKIWKVKLKELETEKILKVINEMAISGIKKISFSGGEPLLRKDIVDIVEYTKQVGISPEINSTGFLFSQKAKYLKNLDLLKLSLDGPEKIHDTSCGRKGAYQRVMEAAKSAAENGIKFIFVTTLSGYNIGYIEDILKLAKRFHVISAFQPLKDIQYLTHDCIFNNSNPLLLPNPEKFKHVINLLIRYKKYNGVLMRNSLRGLRHIYNWPRYEKLKCWAGKIFCMIDPVGNVCPCNRLFYKNNLPNVIEMGFKKAIKNLPQLPPCEGCGFCGSLELNYLMNLKFDVLPSILKIIC